MHLIKCKLYVKWDNKTVFDGRVEDDGAGFMVSGADNRTNKLIIFNSTYLFCTHYRMQNAISFKAVNSEKLQWKDDIGVLGILQQNLKE